MSEPPKPWSVSDFEIHRSHLTHFVKSEIIELLEDDECRKIVIRAPVKSGKREIVEYIALRDYHSGSNRRVHAFMSAWHRTADKDQRDELKRHNLDVFSIITAKDVTTFNNWLTTQIRNNKQIVIHIDECDYGSGNRQLLARVWRETRNNRQINNILYSATPEEVLFSGEVDDTSGEYEEMIDEISQGYIIHYTPPEGYCGPKKFVDEGLIYDAREFFEKDNTTYKLSTQAKEIILHLRTGMAREPNRNILILRLTYSVGSGTRANRKDNKAIYAFLKNINGFPELSDFAIIADKGEKFSDIGNDRINQQEIKWSNKNYWNDIITTTKPVIIVIDQTSSRSTEWKCHDRIFAYHDFRKSVTFSAMSQAQERINHYIRAYNGFQKIRAYGHRKTFLLSAELILYDKYMTFEWKKKKVSGQADKYVIVNTSNNERHATHSLEYLSDEADKILIDLDSYYPISLSPRISGNVRTMQEINCTFYPCNKETFPMAPGRRNPFERAEREMLTNPERYSSSTQIIGYLRRWKIYTFSEIENDKYWGFDVKSTNPRFTICYHDNILGVAVRTPTGKTITINKLTTKNSMYIPRISN